MARSPVSSAPKGPNIPAQGIALGRYHGEVFSPERQRCEAFQAASKDGHKLCVPLALPVLSSVVFNVLYFILLRSLCPMQAFHQARITGKASATPHLRLLKNASQRCPSGQRCSPLGATSRSSLLRPSSLLARYSIFNFHQLVCQLRSLSPRHHIIARAIVLHSHAVWPRP